MRIEVYFILGTIFGLLLYVDPHFVHENEAPFGSGRTRAQQAEANFHRLPLG